MPEMLRSVLVSRYRWGLLLTSWLLATAQATWAADPPHPAQFLAFVQHQADQLNAGRLPPRSVQEWETQRQRIRERLEQAWGGFPEDPCPLEPRVLDVVQRPGYRVEKLLLQTMPGVWMTGLAYVPDAALFPGRRPAVLAVHGHWKRAKQEPVVQSRCIGAAKLGYFVLAVDAFGAGERAIGKALGEYHGEMSGATLLPIGRPLSGIQVYENRRAVDYLQSRAEVDPERIGISGASGGGNQSMYAGCFDERFRAVIPVCSVGTYDAYLGAACCMCEVVPNAITFTEEWGVLGLAAPRGLMVVSATRDAFQFSVREARKSIVGAQAVFDLYQQPDRVFHSVFRWHHDYSQAMREAAYGFFAQQLLDQGDGSPIAEPAHETEDPELIRCFPNESRPDDWLTLPQFAAKVAQQQLADKVVPSDPAELGPLLERQRTVLRDKVFGGWPDRVDLLPTMVSSAETAGQSFDVVSEPGVSLRVQLERSKNGSQQVVVLLDLDGAAAARQSTWATVLRDRDVHLVTVELRATGMAAVAGDKIGRAPDHNSAEWSMWIGRPLLGQWAFDVSRCVDFLASPDLGLSEAKIEVVGLGPAGPVALAAAALDSRISQVTAVGSLASYVTNVPYEGQRMGLLAPGIVRDVGDLGHLAALALPRRVRIIGGVNGAGQARSASELAEHWQPLSTAAATLSVADQVTVMPSADPATIGP
jgi:cephalosporin-C deacetylase-like acetyl esterase